MDDPRITFIQPTLRILRRYFLYLLILAALILLALVFEAGRWSVYRSHPDLSQAEQATAILQKVGNLIQLPAGEQPTMATINDAASAKKAQPFLTNAQNGDILIVFPNAAEALLYRPSTNKLIAVGPVDNTQTQQMTSPSGSSRPSPDATAGTAGQATSSDNATSTKTKK